ncbi:MAG: hypothetical protein LAN84_06395 [Acidobacteriia bacterium]|nr:hypothetical protein [Terriglobia bacterium]
MNMAAWWMRALAVLAVCVLGAFFVHEEIAWRQERARLTEEIAAAHKLVQEADVRQRQRDVALQEALGQIAQRKRAVQTPQEIVRELPRDLPLPAPITLAATGTASVPFAAAEQPSKQAAEPANAARDSSAPRTASDGSNRPAQLPVEDLKPLFDFVQDCKACQAELAGARGNLADERAKTAALIRERDDALRLARGGGFWRRAARAAKWFALGAAAGAIAAQAAR